MSIDPRILDKKNQPEFQRAEPVEEKQENRKKDVPMIAYRKQWTDEKGNRHDEMSEPIPVSEWAEYEKENEL